MMPSTFTMCSHFTPVIVSPTQRQGVHPDRRTVATGQTGKDPVVIVWDSVDCKELMRINQGCESRGTTGC